MSLERWETQIRSKLGQSLRPTFFASNDEEIKGTGGAAIRYLVVGEGDSAGLEPGVYVLANVTPEVYDAYPSLMKAIRSHVALDLMDRSTKAPSIGGEGYIFQQWAVAPSGAIILRLNPLDPDEIGQRIRDVEFGKASIQFVAKPPTS